MEIKCSRCKYLTVCEDKFEIEKGIVSIGMATDLYLCPNCHEKVKKYIFNWTD